MAKDKTGLSDLLPDSPVVGTKVVAGGEEFLIKPFRYLQFPEAAKHIAALGFAIQGGEINISEAIVDGIEHVNALILLAIRRDGQWLIEKDLDADEAANLIMAVFTENLDFFARRMLQVNGMVEKVQGLTAPNTGSMPLIN